MAELNNEKTEILQAKVEGPWVVAWKRFKKNKVSLAGGILFLLILLSVWIVPFVIDYQLQGDLGYTGVERVRNATTIRISQHGFDLANSRQKPSFVDSESDHLLGTDDQGRDILFRVFYGGRMSMNIGFLVAFLTMFIGSTIGVLSGYHGGIVDDILMRFTEIVASLPFLPIMMTLSFIMRWVPQEQTMFVVVLVIGIISWTGLARLVRGQVLSLREQEFMQATEILGLSTGSRLFKHLLPNVLTYVIVSTTLGIGGAILLEAGLSFLGLGVTPPAPSWGNMVQAARTGVILTNFPHMWVPPGLLIILTVVSVNLLGEGLRDALDPKEIR